MKEREKYEAPDPCDCFEDIESAWSLIASIQEAVFYHGMKGWQPEPVPARRAAAALQVIADHLEWHGLRPKEVE